MFLVSDSPILRKNVVNNAITDGGVALPKFPLTIVMKFSNFKSLRISRNSKDFKKANIGSWRVRSRPSRLRREGRYNM